MRADTEMQQMYSSMKIHSIEFLCVCALISRNPRQRRVQRPRLDHNRVLGMQDLASEGRFPHP